MTLATGSRLGPYDILSPLGAGGFGEVYKARDTRLDRTVAIKILPSADSELRARFQREAKAIAALTHPHICTLYDVGHQDGTDFIVMDVLWRRRGLTTSRPVGLKLPDRSQVNARARSCGTRATPGLLVVSNAFPGHQAEGERLGGNESRRQVLPR